jgi:hypothetical protein
VSFHGQKAFTLPGPTAGTRAAETR